MSPTSENHMIFVSGGSRSGKSRYAESRAKEIPGQRTYIATCPIIDQEMEQRIARHREQRTDQNWITIEEPTDLVRALNDSIESKVVLIDCLTLWINNLLYDAQSAQQNLSEDDIRARCEEVTEACRRGNRTIIMVTNELGMGLVPADPVSRLYRDLIGCCNQSLAALSDEVVFMVSGHPLFLKGQNDNE